MYDYKKEITRVFCHGTGRLTVIFVLFLFLFLFLFLHLSLFSTDVLNAGEKSKTGKRVYVEVFPRLEIVGNLDSMSLVVNSGKVPLRNFEISTVCEKGSLHLKVDRLAERELFEGWEIWKVWLPKKDTPSPADQKISSGSKIPKDLMWRVPKLEPTKNTSSKNHLVRLKFGYSDGAYIWSSPVNVPLSGCDKEAVAKKRTGFTRKVYLNTKPLKVSDNGLFSHVVYTSIPHLLNIFLLDRFGGRQEYSFEYSDIAFQGLPAGESEEELVAKGSMKKRETGSTLILRGKTVPLSSVHFGGKTIQIEKLGYFNIPVPVSGKLVEEFSLTTKVAHGISSKVIIRLRVK